MKQRDLIRMSSEELAQFLSQPNTATICTLNRDGSVHAVAMFLAYDHGDLVFHTKAKSQKTRNLERDERVTVLVESGTEYHELRGAELVGRAEIIRDEDAVLHIGELVHRQRNGSALVTVAELRDRIRNRVGIRVRAERVASWDHTKLPQIDTPSTFE